MLSQTAHKQISAQVDQNLFTVGAIAPSSVIGMTSHKTVMNAASRPGAAPFMQPKISSSTGVALSNKYATGR